MHSRYWKVGDSSPKTIRRDGSITSMATTVGFAIAYAAGVDSSFFTIINIPTMEDSACRR